MYSIVHSACLLATTLTPIAALAGEVPLDIKTDLKGTFILVERAGSSDKPVLVIKSVSGDYTNYTKREFDCKAHTVRFLSTGVSLQQMVPLKGESKMSPIDTDSINDQLWHVACAEEG